MAAVSPWTATSGRTTRASIGIRRTLSCATGRGRHTKSTPSLFRRDRPSVAQRRGPPLPVAPVWLHPSPKPTAPIQTGKLTEANYRVWVRGYGLVDSEKVAAQPGQHLDLNAVTAPSL